MKILYTIALIFLMSFGLMAQTTYDFNDLELGNLNGQDDWTTVINSAGSPNEMDVAYSYQGAVSYDGTLGVFYGQSGGQYGRTGSRTTQENFPFDFTLGGPVEIEVDIHTGHWGSLFGFGYDANNNGYLMKGVETLIEIEDNEGGFGFHLGTVHSTYSQINSFYLPDGSTFEYTYPLENISGWHRYKIFIDLDANDGAGSITMFVAEMEGDFVAVSEISDLNLGMTPGSGDSSDPAMWTKIFLHGTGGTSGFDNLIIDQPDTGGLLYQFITFNPLPNHLTTDAPFTINATSNQGLDVEFSVASGPATISGNTLTLTGEAGTVSITASQPGNSEVAAADNVTQSFEVIDPLTVIPALTIRNAVEGEDIRMPELMAMTFSVSTEIEHAELLHISEVIFTIGETVVHGFETNNGFFIGNWTPPAYGNYTAGVVITSSGGVSVSETVNFDVIAEAPSMDFELLTEFVFDGGNSVSASIDLPSFAGTYTSITAVLDYGCPCDDWDRVARVSIRGANGEWMELFKYITPYGVACQDQVDITDFASQLQGNVDFKINFPKSVVSITFEYNEGTPEYKYSWMDNLWQGTYPFGDYENMQPVELYDLNLSGGIEKAYLRLMSGGFSWGPSNTDNAAEFYEATHNINIDGQTEFQQHLWQECNPNPAGCQPQNGTWYYDRHGWCPGSIPILFRYDLSEWIGANGVNLQYEFFPGYVDLCHPHHPDCVSGTTCEDCNTSWNPEINVAGELITYSNELIITAIDDRSYVDNITIDPNPSTGIFDISSTEELSRYSSIEIYNTAGVLIKTFETLSDNRMTLDLTSYSKGIYLMVIKGEERNVTKKIVVQ
ncbi:MAG: T9SS type A sorting domain-containing protein [Bacteroidales bacterium]|nr:T9SS type A sorting domain-containing protein [Bacteroidales bacterium]